MCREILRYLRSRYRSRGNIDFFFKSTRIEGLPYTNKQIGRGLASISRNTGFLLKWNKKKSPAVWKTQFARYLHKNMQL